jgi:hypothetical protein
MMNILEICLSDFTVKRILLEGELERVINDKCITTETRLKLMAELIEKIGLVNLSITQASQYITDQEKQN